MASRTGTTTKRRLVWLDPELDAEVEAVAARRGMKVSPWLRGAILDALAAEKIRVALIGRTEVAGDNGKRA